MPVSFPSREKGPIKNLSIIPAHTFKLNWRRRLEWTITCGLSSFPIMIIMKIEYTIPGETSLLEFALFIKFIISRKRRQTGHIFIRLFFPLFLGVQSVLEVGPTSYETPCIYVGGCYVSKRTGSNEHIRWIERSQAACIIDRDSPM